MHVSPTYQDMLEGFSWPLCSVSAQFVEKITALQCMIQVQGSRFQWCPVKARFLSKGAKKGFHGSWIWQLHPLSRKYHVLSQHNRQDFLESHVQRALTCDCRFETDGWGWKQRLIWHICSTPDEQHCLLLLRSWSSVLQTGSWWKSK